jgi:hypothetical protein
MPLGLGRAAYATRLADDRLPHRQERSIDSRAKVTLGHKFRVRGGSTTDRKPIDRPDPLTPAQAVAVFAAS